MGEIQTSAKNAISLRRDARDGASAPLRAASLDELRRSLLRSSSRVIDMFRAFDQDNSGHISKMEFHAALCALRATRRSTPASQSICWRARSGFAARTASLALAARRLHAVCARAVAYSWSGVFVRRHRPLLGFGASNSLELDQIFDEIDADGSGSLAYSELTGALRRDDIVLAQELQQGAVAFETESKTAVGVRKFKRDGSSSNVLGEASVEAIRRSLASNLSRVTDLMRTLDLDGDGRVTKAEFREALPIVGFGAGGEPAIDALFDSLDRSGDGLIEYSELAQQLVGSSSRNLFSTIDEEGEATQDVQ